MINYRTTGSGSNKRIIYSFNQTNDSRTGLPLSIILDRFEDAIIRFYGTRGLNIERVIPAGDSMEIKVPLWNTPSSGQNRLIYNNFTRPLYESRPSNDEEWRKADFWQSGENYNGSEKNGKTAMSGRTILQLKMKMEIKPVNIMNFLLPKKTRNVM